jgi:hypothetical protein
LRRIRQLQRPMLVEVLPRQQGSQSHHCVLS